MYKARQEVMQLVKSSGYMCVHMRRRRSSGNVFIFILFIKYPVVVLDTMGNMTSKREQIGIGNPSNNLNFQRKKNSNWRKGLLAFSAVVTLGGIITGIVLLVVYLLNKTSKSSLSTPTQNGPTVGNEAAKNIERKCLDETALNFFYIDEKNLSGELKNKIVVHDPALCIFDNRVGVVSGPLSTTPIKILNNLPEDVSTNLCDDAFADNFNSFLERDAATPLESSALETRLSYCIYNTLGCQDERAINYAPKSREHKQEICVYKGCNDPLAFNFDSRVRINDPSMCIFETGTVISTPGPGPNIRAGCMDVQASNYNPNVDIHKQELCTYEKQQLGCMDPRAKNFDSDATVNIQSLCRFRTLDQNCSGPFRSFQHELECGLFESECLDHMALNFKDISQLKNVHEIYHDISKCIYEHTPT